MFTHPNSHLYDSGLIIADKYGTVQTWLAKEEKRPDFFGNRVNAGLHVINPAVLDMVDVDVDLMGTTVNGPVRKVDLDRHILRPLAGIVKMFVTIHGACTLLHGIRPIK